MLLLPDAAIANRYDVVVVGGGIGGLTAGALLQKRGLSVLVIEQHYVPGGPCSIFRRRGVSFDAGVAMMFGFGKSSFGPHHFVMNALEEPIDVIAHEELYRMHIGDKTLMFYKDFERFFDELVDLFPHAERELRAFYDYLYTLNREVLHKRPMVAPPTEAPPPLDLPLSEQLNMARMLPMLALNTKQLLERFIRDPDVLAFFNMLTCTYAYTTAEETPAVLAIAMFVDNHEGGIYYPAGGPHHLSNKLEHAIERRGGRVLCRRSVDEILIENGTARGVRLSDGTVIEADRVITNVTVWNLYGGKLIAPRHFTPERAQWARSLVPTYGSLVVYLAVDREAIPQGTPPIVFLVEDAEKVTGNDITIYISSVDDPSLCPKDQHTVTIIVPSTERWPRPWEPEYQSQAYQDRKILAAQEKIAKVEKVLPGLSKHIRMMEVATPSTIERFTRKDWGAVGGPKQMMGQHLMARLTARGEWKNVYHAGDSTVMGVGCSATTVSGVGAANLVLRDLGLPEYEPQIFDTDHVRIVKGKPWVEAPPRTAPISPENVSRIAQECQLCEDAPCIRACPAHIDIPGFIRRLESGNEAGAARAIRDVHPLSELCGNTCPSERFCEKVCRRLESSPDPVRIRELHGYACRQQRDPIAWKAPSVERRFGRVAVVGAGPAGLTCGHYLAKLGHGVDIYEKSGSAGGVPRHALPPFRFDPQTLDIELEGLLQSGVRVCYGRALGRDVTLRGLQSEYDAVFLAPGCWSGKRFKLPGEGRIDVEVAIEWLGKLRTNPSAVLDKRVVIVGGGSVAADCAMAAHHGRAAAITLITVEPEREMTALPREIEEIKHAGVTVLAGRGAREVRETGLSIARCTRYRDDHGQIAPQLSQEEEACLPCDVLIWAIGQRAEDELTAHLETELSATLPLKVDAQTQQVVGRAKLFAGGDLVRGAGTIVEAVADGRRAALAIAALLQR